VTTTHISEPIAQAMEICERNAQKMREAKARGENPTEELAREDTERDRIEVGRWVSDIVPARFRSAEPDPGLTESFESALCDGRGIILTGKAGRGKTHAACGLLRHFLEVERRPSQAEFHDTGMLLSQLRPGGSESPLTLQRLGRLKLLVLDDLGAHGDSDWVQEQLFTLLNARYQDARTTIITTNLPPKSFVETLGQRLAGRLIETCDVVPMTGHDRRMRLQAVVT
jgi:DNA replication protein DnaC